MIVHCIDGPGGCQNYMYYSTSNHNLKIAPILVGLLIDLNYSQATNNSGPASEDVVPELRSVGNGSFYALC